MIRWCPGNTRVPFESTCGAYSIHALVGGSAGPVYRAAHRTTVTPWNYIGHPRDLVEDARQDAERHQVGIEREAA